MVKCPYLDTVNRQKLDFDQQKVCSVSLTSMNVYACLVCGKFFQGRGKATPAFTHSVDMCHFVFINLSDTRIFCLPDNYEVVDAALNDVKRCLDPQYTIDDIVNLNLNTCLARDVYGVSYLPGFVGLNNLKSTDFLNVVLHALSHISSLRDFFLLPENYDASSVSQSPVVKSFGEVMRKLWSKENFKSVISPLEFMQVVTQYSKNRFRVGHQAESMDLMVWLLNELHRNLSKIHAISTSDSRKRKLHGNQLKDERSIILDTFQGRVEVSTLSKGEHKRAESGDRANGEDDAGTTDDGWKEDVKSAPFLYLSLDIPATPLFRDSQGGTIIPQTPLFELLKKYDGTTWTDVVSSGSAGGFVRKRYRIKELPNYLIFHLVRFTKNNFTYEKNPTIVTFPIKNLEMKDYFFPDENDGGSDTELEQAGIPPDSSLPGLDVVALKSIIARWGSAAQNLLVAAALEKDELVSLARACVSTRRDLAARKRVTKYDLVANICHDTLASQALTAGLTNDNSSKQPKATLAGANGVTAGATSSNNVAAVLSSGCYRVHVLNKATYQWYEIQDLHVSETMPQLIGLSESYILIYEKQQPRS